MTKQREKRKKFVQNRFSAKGFATLFAVAETLFTVLYIKFGATFCVFGKRGWILAALIAALGGCSLLLSLKRERNRISLIAGASEPILLYEAMGMWKFSAAIRCSIVFGAAASLVTAGIWAWLLTKQIKKPSLRHSVWVTKGAHIACILASILLLIVSITGKALIYTHHSVDRSEVDYACSGAQYSVPDYENSLEANIATVAKLDPDGGWAELSVEDRMEVLKTIVRIECRYLGMGSAPQLELAYTEEELLGQYNHGSNTVTLSYNYLMSAKQSGYGVAQCLCHELYHRYQYIMVDFLDAVRQNEEMSEYAALFLLDDATVYEAELCSYVAPSKDSVTYYLYASQSLEQDAEKYGNTAVDEYYNAVQLYFSESN